MIRILHIFYEMANGGIEHFVMDYYRHIDRSKVQFDFLVSVEGKGFFDEEILNLGGKIFHAYPLKRNPIKNFIDIAKIVKKNQYQIVHRHTGSAFGKYELYAAKMGGAKHLILHSHNNSAGNVKLHKIFDKLPLKCEHLACSKEAGDWLFHKRDFLLINNAIDCIEFQFKEEKRQKIREELGITNKFVIGHVGRFEKQKNHIFLLKIFREILIYNPKSILVCVGIGSLQEDFINLAIKMGIYSNIKILGGRSDVNLLMQAFDVFVLPSFYEGFPFVLVEAQASGLKSFVSQNVPKECNITGNIEYIDLKEKPEQWAKKILNKRYVPESRETYANKLKNLGYDIFFNADQLRKFYETLN